MEWGANLWTCQDTVLDHFYSIELLSIYHFERVGSDCNYYLHFGCIRILNEKSADISGVGMYIFILVRGEGEVNDDEWKMTDGYKLW